VGGGKGVSRPHGKEKGHGGEQTQVTQAMNQVWANHTLARKSTGLFSEKSNYRKKKGTARQIKGEKKPSERESEPKGAGQQHNKGTGPVQGGVHIGHKIARNKEKAKKGEQKNSQHSRTGGTRNPFGNKISGGNKATNPTEVLKTHKSYFS